MKSKKILSVVIIIMFMVLSTCSKNVEQNDISVQQAAGQIYLYGEQHSVQKILDKEFELWYENYHSKNMRHLFVEYPYYTAEFLNIWMKADNDDILDAIYDDWDGTAAQNPMTKEFYKKIKNQCPETIFHGTDVGHQFDTTGERFLNYLRHNSLENSEQYLLAQEAIEQGKSYYKQQDSVYRENKMVENFTREFDKLNGESIMGIYGAAHTGFDDMAFNTTSTPCMANQLKNRYGDNIHSEDISFLALEIEPLRVDTIEVNGKKYEASYFGKENITSFSKDYTQREFWRLENSYNDFKDKSKTGDVLPYDNYPMLINTEQVFVIDYTKVDGSIIRKYYRSDGFVWQGMPSTEEFTLE